MDAEGTYTSIDLGTPLNVIEVHVGGVVALQIIEVKPVHPENANIPIFFTLFENVIEVKLLQLENA